VRKLTHAQRASRSWNPLTVACIMGCDRAIPKSYVT
jgi:hypothetical protein